MLVQQRYREARMLCVLAFPLLILLPSIADATIHPTQVLVLYDSADADSTLIASHYQQVHPEVRMQALSGVCQEEEISAEHYLNVIRPQVLSALTPDIQVIVTTKGLPLRIDAGPDQGSGSLNWQRYSSLESELARIDRTDSVEDMGDQYWAPARFNVPNVLPANPYYHMDPDVNGTEGFDRSDPRWEDMRLATRLDGFTAQDVIASIDRAQKAYIAPGRQMIIMDDDPDAAAGAFDRMPLLDQNVLDPAGQPHEYEDTNDPILQAPAPLIGYISHGKNDGSGGLEEGYITSQLDFTLANGAVFHTHESFNAVSFEQGGGQAGQGLIGEWIEIGGTAGLGHVEEPYTGLYNVTNEDRFYEMMFAGQTFAEAAWSATRQLSYVNTFVGDPLMRFRPAIPGDLNVDGVVSFLEAATVIANIGLDTTEQIASEDEGPDEAWLLGDINQDGLIDHLDGQVAVANIGFDGEGIAGDLDDDGTVTFLEVATVVANIGLTSAGWANGDFDLDMTVSQIEAEMALANLGITPDAIPGDLDLDGVVTFVEAATVYNNLNLTGAGWAQGDFNHDGIVDLWDAEQAAAPFGGLDLPETVAIPEPSSLLLAALAGTVVLARRRQRTCTAG